MSTENGISTPPQSDDELIEQTVASEEKDTTPKSKSVSFADPEDDASEDEYKEDVKLVGLPPHLDNPDFSKLTPLSLEIIAR